MWGCVCTCMCVCQRAWLGSTRPFWWVWRLKSTVRLWGGTKGSLCCLANCGRWIIRSQALWAFHPRYSHSALTCCACVWEREQTWRAVSRAQRFPLTVQMWWENPLWRLRKVWLAHLWEVDPPPHLFTDLSLWWQHCVFTCQATHTNARYFIWQPGCAAGFFRI